jgi:hypothetical protein
VTERRLVRHSKLFVIPHSPVGLLGAPALAGHAPAILIRRRVPFAPVCGHRQAICTHLRMRVNAYILAADPTWIEIGIRSYYDVIQKLVVSFDESRRGWTGSPVNVEECIRRIQAIDVSKKVQLVAGTFARPGKPAMESETIQRQHALDHASKDSDWVLQLDPDEFLPNPTSLLKMLEAADILEISAVEWPMRVLFRKLKCGRFLEICGRGGSDRFEYPGPIALRSGTQLFHARQVNNRILRAVVDGDAESLQVCLPPSEGEIRRPIAASDAIVHNSWARDSLCIRGKIASWGHSNDMRTRFYYHLKWKPASIFWRFMHDLHPFARGLWPALKISRFVFSSEDMEVG